MAKSKHYSTPFESLKVLPKLEAPRRTLMKRRFSAYSKTID
jgi:hypothetical protein